jgi:hypothetical protein
MSSFGAKRKPRAIQTLDDDDDLLNPSPAGGDEPDNRKSQPVLQHPIYSSFLLIIDLPKSNQADALPAESASHGRIKFGRNKPAKSSALRRSININQDDAGAVLGGAPTAASRDDQDEESSEPVVIRPALSRSGSTKQKNRPASSRLSFGPTDSGEAASETDAAAGAGAKQLTPKRTLGQRALENNALRRSASLKNLTGSLPLRFGGDEDRPRYSKEYLEELQSSTPNTPQNLSSLQVPDDEDAMELDQSELEGALVVQPTDLAPISAKPSTTPQILTEAQIRERKERRARLAKEAEYIPLEGGSEDEEEVSGQGGARVTVHFPSKKEKESRLIAEDEDLGEGYDEFVSDGGLALGKKAEREAARRHRQEMAELIQAAEGEDGSDAEGSDDSSEAERRAAYEAAQRRAGMDGLHRRELDQDVMDLDGGGAGLGPDAIPRMKPLPKLNEVLQRMREIVQGLEDEVTRKRATIEGLEKEREEILAREKEVQGILDQAGAKYQAALESLGGSASKLVGQSPLRPLPPGLSGDFPGERGLESFGATPTKADGGEDMV